MSTEVENCNLHGDNPIIAGDINAKIDSIEGNIIGLSQNGKLLSDVIEKYSLQVLNFHPVCEGKWTRVQLKNGITERSVIDYIITNNVLFPCFSSITIDEERMITPFNTVKVDGNITRVSTDYNTILTRALFFY